MVWEINDVQILNPRGTTADSWKIRLVEWQDTIDFGSIDDFDNVWIVGGTLPHASMVMLIVEEGTEPIDIQAGDKLRLFYNDGYQIDVILPNINADNTVLYIGENGNTYNLPDLCEIAQGSPTPTPSVTPTATPSPPPTITPSVTVTPSQTPMATVTPSSTPIPTPSTTPWTTPEPVCRTYVLARSGPQGPYRNMLAIVDREDFNPDTNEIPVGIGDTGTRHIKAIALNPADGEIYAVNYNRLGTFRADGVFAPYPNAIGRINGPYGLLTICGVDGLSFEPETGILWAAMRKSHLRSDVIFQIDINTGDFVPGAFNGDDYIVVPDNYWQRDVDDIAFRPDGTLFGSLGREGRNHSIAEINKASGNTIGLGHMYYPPQVGIIEDMKGLSFDPEWNLWGTTGNRWASSGNSDQLWNIVWNWANARFEVEEPRPLTHGTDYSGLTFCVWRHDPITAFSRWLLPAGATAIDGEIIDSYILVSNPNPKEVPVSITFMGENGPIGYTTRVIPPNARLTVKINDYVPAGHADAGAVSSVVRSPEKLPIHVERAMYFPGDSGPAGWSGGHDTIGIDHPATEWNLPEGATHMFDQFIHVLNPGDAPASVTAIFMNQAGFTWQTQATVGAESNWTIHVNSEVGVQTEISTQVTSDRPVAVDRTMYWNRGGADVWTGGHTSRGISQSSTAWHLAEGANHLFDHYLLVSNPSSSEWAEVRLTFMDDIGDTAVRLHTLPPQSRYTFKVNDLEGWENKGQVSTMVESTNGVPIFAERAMYWPRGGPWVGGHNSIGSSNPGIKWHLPEGANHLFDHYVLVSNPFSSGTADVKITFMDQNGNTAVHTQAVGPMSRYTVKVNDIPGWGSKDQVSTVVESVNSVPVFVERAMYWHKGRLNWIGGHCTVGIAELLPYDLSSQYHPAGSQQENVLVYNPSAETVARVDIEVRKADGSVALREYEIPPETGRVIRVMERVPDAQLIRPAAAPSMSVKSNIPVVIEGAAFGSGGREWIGID